MKQLRSEAGFSLVELLAVVLILAVLSAVAVPLYLNTREAAAARTCKANIAAIAAAESAYALRYGEYTTVAQLVGKPEGLSSAPTCPLDGTGAYLVSATTDGTTDIADTGVTTEVFIKCENAGVHTTALGITGATDAWNKSLAAIPTSHETGLP